MQKYVIIDSKNKINVISNHTHTSINLVVYESMVLNLYHLFILFKSFVFSPNSPLNLVLMKLDHNHQYLSHLLHFLFHLMFCHYGHWVFVQVYVLSYYYWLINPLCHLV